MGKCPFCDNQLMEVKAEEIAIKYPAGSVWKGASYICPFCNKIISIQIDPIAIKAEIINGIKK